MTSLVYAMHSSFSLLGWAWNICNGSEERIFHTLIVPSCLVVANTYGSVGDHCTADTQNLWLDLRVVSKTEVDPVPSLVLNLISQRRTVQSKATTFELWQQSSAVMTILIVFRVLTIPVGANIFKDGLFQNNTTRIMLQIRKKSNPNDVPPPQS